MPLPRRALPPRTGRHRRTSDAEAKARSFPSGAARERLRRLVWPSPIERDILRWVAVEVVEPPE